jgi:LysM repeat protein/ABC-type branched-subunit amino acid transport system substrate-binding protein
MRRKIFIIVLLFLPLSAMLAQTVQPVPVAISTEKVKIQGKVFYVHHVLKGQTLYSISRVYGVTQEEIHKCNPQLAGTGLQEGMFLQIPVVEGKTSTDKTSTTFTAPETAVVKPVTPPPAATTTPTPPPAATVTSTTPPPPAAATSVTPPPSDRAPLYQPLDAVPEALPVKEEQPAPPSCRYVENSPDINRCEAYVYNPKASRFQVALLLPFAAQQLSQTPADTVNDATRFRSSDNFVEFYGGALIAVQDMRDKGFVVDVSVFDVATPSALEELINSQQLKNVDLIIGPIYATSLAALLPYAGKYNIPVVSPLDPKGETLLPDYPNLFQVSPSSACQQLKLLSDISPEKDNIILVYDEDSEEQDLIAIYKSVFSGHRLSLLPYKVAKGIAIRESIRKQLVSNKENRVIVASNNEALVTDLTANLSPLQSRLKYPVTIYGQARWRYFENVDISFLHAMNLHLVLPFFVDYKDNDVKDFVARYRLDFNADPSQFAFQGYDVMKFFLTALHRYGPRFGDCISLLHAKLLQGTYQFHRLTPQGGFINTGASLIRYTPEFDIERN